MDDMHKRKIDMADEIYVIGCVHLIYCFSVLPVL